MLPRWVDDLPRQERERLHRRLRDVPEEWRRVFRVMGRDLPISEWVARSGCDPLAIRAVLEVYR